MKNITRYFQEEHSLTIGDKFEENKYRGLNLDINGTKFNIQAKADNDKNKISVLSIVHDTNEKKELIEALKEIRSFFEIPTIPVINEYSTLITEWDILSDFDSDTGEEIRLIIFNRGISMLVAQYRLELKIEVKN